jgi:hypothetical protein
MAWLRDIAWPFESAIFDGEACAGDGHEGIQAVFELARGCCRDRRLEACRFVWCPRLRMRSSARTWASSFGNAAPRNTTSSWRCGSPASLVGHVRRDASGFFQYYRGPLNELLFEFEDDDLDRLKQRIAARESPAALSY